MTVFELLVLLPEDAAHEVAGCIHPSLHHVGCSCPDDVLMMMPQHNPHTETKTTVSVKTIQEIIRVKGDTWKIQ